MNPVEILDEAVRLINMGWTKGAWARDSEARPVNYSDPEATCWCSSGAILRASQPTGSDVMAVLGALNLATPIKDSIEGFNDLPSTGVEDVLAVFAEARETLSR